MRQADLLDEPFLALPASAGPLRDYWLATDVGGGRPARIGAEVASTEETYEALVLPAARQSLPLPRTSGYG